MKIFPHLVIHIFFNIKNHQYWGRRSTACAFSPGLVLFFFEFRPGRGYNEVQPMRPANEAIQSQDMTFYTIFAENVDILFRNYVKN